MLIRRAPIKRAEFKPRAPQRKDRDPDRLRSVPTVTPGAFRAPQPVGAPVAPIEKETPLRSEAYRRAVASLPCAYCGIEGYSQHAHENDGKGARLKVDDRRAMPLCCSRPGIEGCHVAFDQYRLVPGGRDAHADLGRALAEQTRNRLNALGLWPAGVPQFTTSTTEAA